MVANLDDMFSHDEAPYQRSYDKTNIEAYALMKTLARGYKTLFMLNSAEHEIYPAHNC